MKEKSVNVCISLARFILTLICVTAILLSGSAKAYAEEAQQSNYVKDRTGMNIGIGTADGNVQGISVSIIGGKEYIFLPSNASTKKLIFNFNEKYAVSAVKADKVKDLQSGAPVDISQYLGSKDGDGKSLLIIRLTDAAGNISDHEMFVMQSKSIAAMYISSADPNKAREFVEADKSNKATGSMSLINSKGNAIYRGALSQIKGRGNTTFSASKKPYQIKLEEACDLTQSGNPSKTWVLLANAFDPTLIHNTAAFKLAKSMGLNAPDYKAIDLYYDGTYRGNYLLCEKVEVGAGRVDIHNLEKDTEKANGDKDLGKLQTATGTNKYGDTIQYVTNVANPENISGGYLLEQDDAYYKAERSYFILSNGTPIVIKSPENCSKEQVEYISDYVEEMIRAAANDGSNPDNGKSVWDYVDKKTLAKYLVLQEVVKNADAFCSSTYMYLNNDGSKLVMGPVWDFDDSYGIREDMMPVEGIVGAGFIGMFINLPDFRKEVKSYYSSTGYSKAANLGISNLASEISASRQMDDILWKGKDVKYYETGDYGADLEYMKNYAGARNRWLKSEFANW